MLQTRERPIVSPPAAMALRPVSSPREVSRGPQAEDVAVCAGWQDAWPVIMVITRRRLVVVTMPQGEARISTFTLRQVLAVEEDRTGNYTTVTVLTARSTLVVTRVATARAWTFCRAVRRAILGSN